MIELVNRKDIIDALQSEPYNEPRYPQWYIDKLNCVPFTAVYKDGKTLYNIRQLRAGLEAEHEASNT